jgi:cell division septal protein FtsQ
VQRKNTQHFHSDHRSPVVNYRVNTAKTILFSSSRIAIKISFFALCIAILGWLIYLGYQAFVDSYRSNPEYQLRLIQLNKNSAMNEEDLVRVAEIPLNISIMSIKIEKIQNALSSRPEIISATVRRNAPGTLHVHLDVRKPVAWVECLPKNFIAKKLQQGHLVDQNAVLYPCPRRQFDEAQALPVIVVAREEAEKLVVGKKVETQSMRRALQLLALAQGARHDSSPSVARLETYRSWGILLTTSDGIEATFGLDDQQRQMSDFFLALQHAKSLGQQIKSINLIPR